MTGVRAPVLVRVKRCPHSQGYVARCQNVAHLATFSSVVLTFDILRFDIMRQVFKINVQKLQGVVRIVEVGPAVRGDEFPVVRRLQKAGCPAFVADCTSIGLINAPVAVRVGGEIGVLMTVKYHCCSGDRSGVFKK